MKLLFKVSNTGGNPAKVVHSNFREHYSGINVNTAWATLEPTIRKVTTEHLIPVVTREIYDVIADKYDADEALTDQETDFLALCQDVIAYFTMLSVAPELNVGVSD